MLTSNQTWSANAPLGDVYDYLADMSTLGSWNPHATGGRRQQGHDSAVLEYACTLSVCGIRLPMVYTSSPLMPFEDLQWSGRGGALATEDFIHLSHHPRGRTIVQWRAQWSQTVVPPRAEKLFLPYFRRFCEVNQRSLQQALERLHARRR